MALTDRIQWLGWAEQPTGYYNIIFLHMNLIKAEHEIIFPCAKSCIPEFLLKLYSILENGGYGHIICWDTQGTNILIKDVASLEEQVLSQFFRHRKYSSFVRQLNMYNFHKNLELNPLLPLISFYNINFRKGFPGELLLIKRKDTRPRKRKISRTKIEETSRLESVEDSEFVTDNIRLVEKELIAFCKRHPVLAPELTETFMLTNLLLGRDQYYPALGDFGSQISQESLLRSRHELILKTEYTLAHLETRCNLDLGHD